MVEPRDGAAEGDAAGGGDAPWGGDAALRRFLDAMAVEEAGRSRSRRRWVTQQAREATTRAGILSAAAATGHPVELALPGGRWWRGTVLAVSPGLVYLVSGAPPQHVRGPASGLPGHRHLVVVDAVAAIRTPPGLIRGSAAVSVSEALGGYATGTGGTGSAGDVAGGAGPAAGHLDRQGSVALGDVLAGLAADEPDVVVTERWTTSHRGRLLGVGDDVVLLGHTDAVRGDHLAVALDAVAAVTF